MKTNKHNTAQYHQEKIAIKTLRMNPAMAAVMGGTTPHEAEAFLRSIGYSDKEIEKAKE